MTRKWKRLTISLMISLIIFSSVKLVYGKYEKTKYKKAYVITKDIYEGEQIKKEDLIEIRVDNVDKALSKVSNIFNNNSINKKLISKYDMKKGQILTDDIVAKNIKENIENMEYISVNINSPDEANSYQINKGDMVNVYFTAKLGAIDTLLESKEKIYSSNQKDSMVTYKILENVEVIGTFDETGNAITQTNGLTKVFNTVTFRVDKETAMLISNIKGAGNFNLTKIK